VDARYPMDELNERLKLGIEESHDYDSVGGYVMDRLGAIPSSGQTFEVEAIKWTVDEMNGHRIVRVRLTAADPWPDEMLVDAGIPPPSRDESDRPATTGG